MLHRVLIDFYVEKSKKINNFFQIDWNKKKVRHIFDSDSAHIIIITYFSSAGTHLNLLYSTVHSKMCWDSAIREHYWTTTWPELDSLLLVYFILSRLYWEVSSPFFFPLKNIKSLIFFFFVIFKSSYFRNIQKNNN